MADLEANPSFDSSELPLSFDGTFNPDSLFGNTFGEGLGASPFQFSSPGWPMDSPGRFGAPRNDSSVTAIMTKVEMKPRSTKSSTSAESSSESPASSQSSSRRKRKSPTSQGTSNNKHTTPSQRNVPYSLSPQHQIKKPAGVGGKLPSSDSSFPMSTGLTPDAIAFEQNMDSVNNAMAAGTFFNMDSAASSPGAFQNTMTTSAFDALNTTPRTTFGAQELPMVRFAQADVIDSR